MRQTFCVVASLIISTPSAAQVVEAGVGISRACIGSEGSACGQETGAMWAAHASAWIADRFEIGIRLAALSRPDLTYSVPHDDRFNAVDDPAIRQLARIDVASRGRSRRIVSGEAMYHFGRGSVIRGLLGLGVGTLIDRFEQTCAPAGCERLMPILSSPVGRSTNDLGNFTIIAGASGRAGRRVQLRGGVRFHNFAGEELSTAEIFVAAGYRFGRQ
jgi:hypothetical protein